MKNTATVNHEFIFKGDMNGWGTSIEHNGFTYVGNWKNGLKHGTGTYIDKDVTYRGIWNKDMPHGQGEIISSEGEITICYFDNGELLSFDRKENKSKPTNINPFLGKKDRNIGSFLRECGVNMNEYEQI